MSGRFVALAATTLLLTNASPALAHGIGGRQDLDVPLAYFIVGAGIVLVVTFAGLASLWPEPRLQAPPIPRTVEWGWFGPVAAVMGVIGLAGLALVVGAGAVGIQSSARNPASVLVYVWFWLALPFASVLLGDLYPAVDPWRWIRPLFGASENLERGHGSLVAATVVLMLFVWQEIVSPFDEPRVLAILAVGYTTYLMAAGARGRRSDDVDGFAVYNRYLGAIGPLGRDERGRPALFGWFRRLPALPEQPGMVAFVAAMIGTVSFDGAGGTDGWLSIFESPAVAILEAVGLGSSAALTIARTLGLLLVTGLIYGAYMLASWAAARFGGRGNARWVARRFAHTLVPIAFAYAFAHYFTLILFEGQLLFSTLSDPFGLGWNLFGTADRPIDFSLIQDGSAWVWYVQLGAIVGGHVAGVVLAHDRALADFEGPNAVRSQYAMLVLMVFLTGLGLAILST